MEDSGSLTYIIVRWSYMILNMVLQDRAFNLTRPDVRFGSHNLQDCKLILQDWIHNLQDFKLVLYMSKILKCRTWKGQSYIRFQDCNGLLQGRIHDGVMCVLLHQGSMWLYMQLLGCLLGLCFPSLHTVIKNLLRNSLGTISSSFSKAYVHTAGVEIHNL